MSWEQRGNRWYYYRKQRIGRHVYSKYAGPDFVGQLAELEDEIERLSLQEAKAEQDAAVEEIRRLSHVGRLSMEAENRIRTVIQAAYLVNGYHTHHRQWRRRRKK